MGERQFGPYLLVQQIAVGGMAEIHLAKTHGIAGFEKYVALKMIHPNFSSDEQFIEMLIDEAKISVQLQHINIAQTFDLGRVGDTYYITMEFVDGADLYKILRRAAERGIQVPVDVAAFIAKEMANGLDYAHRKRDLSGQSLGIVHRDVSPQNVLISHSGEVKMVDFGIAKATMKASQTAVGVIKGKYYYMSPEQAWGDRVDHRTDVFSTGICLYESLTGQMLYLEEDLHRLLDTVRKANIAPPTVRRRDIPPQLERIVMRALHKDRDQRYPSAGEFATDLERFLHVYSPVFTPTKLAEFFRHVIGDEQPPTVEEEVPEPSFHEVPMHTMRLEPEQILNDSAEFNDENSIIFDTRAPSHSGFGQDSGHDFSTSAHTLAGVSEPENSFGDDYGDGGFDGSDFGPGGLENIEEQTMVSGPPGFGVPGGPPPGANEYEATLKGTGMELDGANVPLPGGDDVHEGPTLLQNQSGGLQERLREYNRRVAGQSQASKPPPAPASSSRPPSAPPPRVPAGTGSTNQPPPRPNAPTRPQARPPARRQSPGKGKGASHPAVAASTPQPAVSLTGGGRRPRRTPRGVEAQSGPGESLIASLVGKGSAGAPVKRPAGGPDHVGTDDLREQATIPARPGSQPGNGASAPPSPAWSGDPASPGPQGQPGQVSFDGNPAPFSPLPSGQPPSSFTKQLQALELEEIPESYKVGRRTPRWILAGLLITACVAAGVGLGIALLDRQEKETALRIESMPAGARVTLNGISVTDPTPVRHPVTPGQRYEIVFELEGYQTKSHEVIVPVEGGEYRVPVRLQRVRLTVEIESTPEAQLLLNGVIQGQTPRTLTDLDPDTEYVIELRKKGYRPHKERLDLNEKQLKSRLEVELERQRR